MKNQDVFDDFVDGRESRTNNVFSQREGNLLVCYSYGRHFPMAIRLADVFVVNTDRYSNTTSKQQTQLGWKISGGRKLERNTKQIQDIITALREVDYPTEKDLILLEL